MATNADLDTVSSTPGPDGDNGMSILPLYIKLILSRSDIATQLTPGDASRMTPESFMSLVAHDEGGETPLEIDCDSLDPAAGMHNASNFGTLLT